jgi:hypothetical protein
MDGGEMAVGEMIARALWRKPDAPPRPPAQAGPPLRGVGDQHA